MKSLLNRWDTKEEASIWQQAIFVFDSSSLLNFYEFSTSTRQNIYDNIFPLLKERLWIANQTEYEFLKHRDKLINRPDGLYREIKEQHYPAKHLKAFILQYEQLKTRTGKNTRHPYITPETFKDFDAALGELTKHQQMLESSLNQQIDERLADHAKVIQSDALLTYFQVTTGYSYSELMEIVKEGEFRYRHKIPPGYADEKTKDEFGIAKFGDLIIWKQVIGLAKRLKKPILLVIDDLKLDWCITDKQDKAKLIAPREELIKEIQDEGGVKFWAYSTSQFLHNANQFLKSRIAADVIEEVQEVVKNRGVLVEEAVFAWAQERFNSDETLLATDFWKNDTGADIIQTLDGVLFSIQIKNLTGPLFLKNLDKYVDEIMSINSGEVTFENNIVVLVTTSFVRALHLQELIGKRLPPSFLIFAGCINEKGEFVEAKR